MPRSRWYGSADAHWRLAVVALVVLAVPLRLHGLDRSLWLDETWVANSVLEPDLASVFYYEPWLQTTPPVFLLLERLIVSLLPFSNAAFRALPFLFGILGVALGAYLALRLLRPATAFVMVLVLVFSSSHIIYSQTLKQFTGDMFAACVMTWVGLFYLQRRSTPSLITAVLVFVAVAGLSYNAVLFTPALLVGALFGPPADGRRWPTLNVRRLHVLVILGAITGTALVNYYVFIQPNLGTNILGGEVRAARSWHQAMELDKVLNLVRMFRHFTFDWAWDALFPKFLVVASAAVAFAGFLHLVVHGHRGRPSNLDKAVVLALPMLGALGLNLIGYYPLANLRLSLFLLPSALLLFGFGVQALAAARLPGLPISRDSQRWRTGLEGGVALAFVGVLVLRLLLGGGPAPFLTWQLGSDEDAEAAVAHLARASGEGDLIYLDTSMLEPFRFYSRVMPIEQARILRGRLVWPCCPRGVSYVPSDTPARDVADEVERILANGVPRKLWMLYTGRPFRWQMAGASYPDLFREQLQARGCFLTDTPAFEGIQLEGYVCDQGIDTSVGAPRPDPSFAAGGERLDPPWLVDRARRGEDRSR